MTEQEINKIITEKQKELESLCAQLNRSKCMRHLEALTEALSKNDDVIQVISSNNLNVSDAQYVGERIAKDFDKIFANYVDDIEARQCSRRRKSEARATRNAQKRYDACIVPFISLECGYCNN
ncbi:MAG: hypothetical protein J6N21_15000 [Butyrivibrio sp.]|nr:hypothetical protein [Butyrivibrio sp.]